MALPGRVPGRRRPDRLGDAANGVSFRHAVELLRADSVLAAGVGVPVKLAAPVAPSASDGELLNQVVGFYHQRLLESPEALAYLCKRGLGDPELIARFRLGYANRTLGYRLPAAGEERQGRRGHQEAPAADRHPARLGP